MKSCSQLATVANWWNQNLSTKMDKPPLAKPTSPSHAKLRLKLCIHVALSHANLRIQMKLELGIV